MFYNKINFQNKTQSSQFLSQTRSYSVSLICHLHCPMQNCLYIKLNRKYFNMVDYVFLMFRLKSNNHGRLCSDGIFSVWFQKKLIKIVSKTIF